MPLEAAQPVLREVRVTHLAAQHRAGHGAIRVRVAGLLRQYIKKMYGS